MKKILLLILAVGIAGATIAQTINTKLSNANPRSLELLMEPPSSGSSILSDQGTPESYTKSVNGVNATFVPIGQAGNAYSTAFGTRTSMWADPMINSVVFVHRMTGGTEVEGNSRVSYDVSTDGGATWAVNNQVYEPTGPDQGTGYPDNAGRYPMGAIINPAGNTNPDDAYFTYLATAMNGENNNWGGYGIGSNMLTNLPPVMNQVNLGSGDGIWRLLPSALHITQDAVSWYVQESSEYSAADDDYIYTGELILASGGIVDGEIEYDEELYGFLDAGDEFLDMKIAFAPDGQTGYIAALTRYLGDWYNYHPVLLKTTNGGEDWSDPIDVQFGGEDGIESIINWYPDSTIRLMDGWTEWDGDRMTLSFCMGWDFDLAVDALGNPYFGGNITLGGNEGEEGMYTGLSTHWSLYSKDGGVTWDADPVWNYYWWDGLMGDLPLYNKPNVSIDYEGENLFFSWLDSDAENAEDNSRPNIFVMGYNVADDSYTDVVNVTYFTNAWNRAYQGEQSYYVFKTGEFSFEIPFQYTQPTDITVPTDPVSYWYIDDFILSPVAVPELPGVEVNFAVSQNYPNPATNSTEILVTAESNLPIELSVSNMLGQRVYSNAITSGATVHAFRVDVSSFDPGLYLYTVKIGSKTTTKKMLVK